MADKITMNMISDEIKQMARQAAEDNTYSQIRGQLKDKLKEQFPSSKPLAISDAVRMLRGISAMPAGQEMREAKIYLTPDLIGDNQPDLEDETTLSFAGSNRLAQIVDIDTKRGGQAYLFTLLVRF